MPQGFSPKIDLFALFMLLGIGQGLFLSVVFLLKKSHRNKSNTYFGLLFLVISFTIIEIFLNYTGYILNTIYLFSFSNSFYFLIGPLLYIYLAIKLNGVLSLKWLMMNANHRAYFMGTNKNILSLTEIRNKIINREEVVFNDELGYEGSVGMIKFISKLFGIDKFYKWYFSKNIFKYETVVRNEFDELTDRTADIIQLVPSDYLNKTNTKQRLRKYERAHAYYTDNEDFFWQKPMGRK